MVKAIENVLIIVLRLSQRDQVDKIIWLLFLWVGRGAWGGVGEQDGMTSEY